MTEIAQPHDQAGYSTKLGFLAKLQLGVSNPIEPITGWGTAKPTLITGGVDERHLPPSLGSLG